MAFFLIYFFVGVNIFEEHISHVKSLKQRYQVTCLMLYRVRHVYHTPTKCDKYRTF